MNYRFSDKKLTCFFDQIFAVKEKTWMQIYYLAENLTFQTQNKT